MKEVGAKAKFSANPRLEYFPAAEETDKGAVKRMRVTGGTTEVPAFNPLSRDACQGENVLVKEFLLRGTREL